MRNSQSNTLFPWPEWNQGDKGAGWKVIDNGGQDQSAWVDAQSKRIQVPLTGPCPLCFKRHTAAVRNHEQAHIRFTFDRLGRWPALPKGLRNIYWQVAEDIRIDKVIAMSGVNQAPVLCEYEAPKWEGTLKGMDDKHRILWHCAAGEPDVKFSKECIRKSYNAQIHSIDPDQTFRIRAQAVAMMDRATAGTFMKMAQPDGTTRDAFLSFPRLKATYDTAWWLQNLLESLGVEEPVKLENDDEKGEFDTDPNDPDNYDPNAESPDAEQGLDGDGDPADENPNPYGNTEGWMPMVIEEVPLVRGIPGRLVQSWAASDEGTFMKSAHRWMTDQKIFAVKRRYPGGTVLIDCSGSMSLSQEQVYEWMMQVPGVQVACYASGDDGYSGVLRIIARNGKVCEKKMVGAPGGLNGVDGPALAWLGRQAAPRVWVSDGWVNGAGGNTSDALYFDRDMLVSRGRVTWVDPHVVEWKNVGKEVIKALLRPRH